MPKVKSFKSQFSSVYLVPAELYAPFMKFLNTLDADKLQNLNCDAENDRVHSITDAGEIEMPPPIIHQPVHLNSSTQSSHTTMPSNSTHIENDNNHLNITNESIIPKDTENMNSFMNESLLSNPLHSSSSMDLRTVANTANRNVNDVHFTDKNDVSMLSAERNRHSSDNTNNFTRESVNTVSTTNDNENIETDKMVDAHTSTEDFRKNDNSTQTEPLPRREDRTTQTDIDFVKCKVCKGLFGSETSLIEHKQLFHQVRRIKTKKKPSKRLSGPSQAQVTVGLKRKNLHDKTIDKGLPGKIHIVAATPENKSDTNNLDISMASSPTFDPSKLTRTRKRPATKNVLKVKLAEEGDTIEDLVGSGKKKRNKQEIQKGGGSVMNNVCFKKWF